MINTMNVSPIIFFCKVNIYVDESSRDLTAMPSHTPATVETVVYLKDTAHLTWTNCL